VDAESATAGDTGLAEASADDLYVIAVSKGVGGGNIAAYPTDEGVILVDDMFGRDYAAVMEQVKSLTGKPVKYVLNTHQHDDHAGGNAKMLAASAGAGTRSSRRWRRSSAGRTED